MKNLILYENHVVIFRYTIYLWIGTARPFAVDNNLVVRASTATTATAPVRVSKTPPILVIVLTNVYYPMKD